MDYKEDEIAKRCLFLARQSKSKVGFGAILFNSKGKIIGQGRNRRSQKGEFELLGGGIDYATHAEQSAAIDALKKGFKIKRSDIYVLGLVLQGKQRGRVSVRKTDEDIYFSCIKCAKMLVKFNIGVYIPLPGRWHRLSAEEALSSAKELKNKKKHLSFTPHLG